MNYADRLDAAVAACGNPCLVGLDPHLELLPEEFAVARDTRAPRAERAAAVEAFLCEVVALCAGVVPAVKPQSAFFERLGADGARAWEHVVAAARAAGLLVIGDVKRGDIASTSRAYAQAFLEDAGDARCDAITVNPYLGADSIEPLLEVCARADAGLYVLVRTSNPGSGLFQEHGEPPLAHVVAREVERWGAELRGACGLSSIGAVVGATHSAELATLRALMPHTPLLIPGYGAQGAGALEAVPGFLAGGRGALVNSSRGILYAWRSPEHAGKPWRDASRDAIDAMVREFREALAPA
ncbi:MAG: orotidine-5'-phosphate decarboxylase [Planctomycetes bacterium]|nr:orotidine-5'-phosphate decarboxylase [Planctomycetota bacterium]